MNMLKCQKKNRTGIVLSVLFSLFFSSLSADAEVVCAVFTDRESVENDEISLFSAIQTVDVSGLSYTVTTSLRSAMNSRIIIPAFGSKANVLEGEIADSLISYIREGGVS